MGRLRLPPIQHSFVWRNGQIVNYWDSLVRGYPAGMMLVTRVKPDGASHYGRGLDGKTEELTDTDFQTFDGQQRLTAILLGLGEGSLGRSLQLWVDIGKPNGSGDRLYELRINSSGADVCTSCSVIEDLFRVPQGRDRRGAHTKRRHPQLLLPRRCRSPCALLRHRGEVHTQSGRARTNGSKAFHQLAAGLSPCPTRSRVPRADRPGSPLQTFGDRPARPPPWHLQILRHQMATRQTVVKTSKFPERYNGGAATYRRASGTGGANRRMRHLAVGLGLRLPRRRRLRHWRHR